MKRLSFLSKFAMAIGLTMLLIQSCDYEAKDFPDKLEGQSYDLALPVFHDTFSMTELSVEGIPIILLPANKILNTNMLLKYELNIPDYSFLTSDFDTDATMVVERMETLLNWSDNLPKGITIQLLAYGDVSGKRIYLIDPENGSIQCGSKSAIRKDLILSSDDLQQLPKMANVRISFALGIDKGTTISVASLREASASFGIGMRIKFNLTNN